MLPRSTRCFDPTGWPEATYSSTTLRRISRCLEVISICMLCRQILARPAGAQAIARAVAPSPRNRPRLVSAAEIRRLVPPVSRTDEARDHPLEVGLHRFGLTNELGAAYVGKPRPRLRLELVAREMLRLERERLAQIALEIGGALAGDPV